MGLIQLTGRDVDQLAPSSTEMKERVKVYLYSLPVFYGLFMGELWTSS